MHTIVHNLHDLDQAAVEMLAGYGAAAVPLVWRFSVASVCIL